MSEQTLDSEFSIRDLEYHSNSNEMADNGTGFEALFSALDDDYANQDDWNNCSEQSTSLIFPNQIYNQFGTKSSDDSICSVVDTTASVCEGFRKRKYDSQEGMTTSSKRRSSTFSEEDIFSNSDYSQHTQLSDKTVSKAMTSDHILTPLRIPTSSRIGDSPYYTPDHPSDPTPPAKQFCQCQKSKCLKKYCPCFASNSYCIECRCGNCANKEGGEGREAAVSAVETNNLIAWRSFTKACNTSPFSRSLTLSSDTIQTTLSSLSHPLPISPYPLSFESPLSASSSHSNNTGTQIKFDSTIYPSTQLQTVGLFTENTHTNVSISNQTVVCSCKNIKCIKKYCSCFQMKTPCGRLCSCISCRNTGI